MFADICVQFGDTVWNFRAVVKTESKKVVYADMGLFPPTPLGTQQGGPNAHAIAFTQARCTTLGFF